MNWHNPCVHSQSHIGLLISFHQKTMLTLHILFTISVFDDYSEFVLIIFI